MRELKELYLTIVLYNICPSLCQTLIFWVHIYIDIFTQNQMDKGNLMIVLKEVELENKQTVFIQVESDVEFMSISSREKYISTGSNIETKGIIKTSQESIKNLGEVIQAMSTTVVNSLKESQFVNIEKITLDFGIKLAGEAGVPFIARGKSEGAVNIKVEFKPEKINTQSSKEPPANKK